MSVSEENVFVSLYQYGPHAEENYLTESLVFLLKTLLQREPEAGVVILNHVCGGTAGVKFTDAGAISLSTQVAVEEGRPDIEIRAPDILVYVEVKYDAPLGPMQLERYYAELHDCGLEQTRLVLLTRSKLSAINTSLAPTQYRHICWYQIYDWLFEANAHDEVCAYFVRNFLRFLEDKNMSLPKVEWQYIDGVPALLKLTDMLKAAISEAISGQNMAQTAGWNWRGFYVSDYFIGVRLNKPLVIVFQNNKGDRATYRQNLDLEQVHFFSINKDEQFERLVAFVRKAYAEAPPASGQAGVPTG